MNFSSVNIHLTIGCVEFHARCQIDTNSGRVNDLQDKYTFQFARPAGLVAPNRFVEACASLFGIAESSHTSFLQYYSTALSNHISKSTQYGFFLSSCFTLHIL